MSTPDLPAGRFATITADPPWTYVYSTRTTEKPGTGWNGGTDRHYSTLTLDEIKSIPVASVAADDAVLWLWIVNPMLRRCIEVIDAWGFEYRGILTWAKTTRGGRPYTGTGYWLRGATEHAVLAVRGKPAKPLTAIPTWFAAPVTRHSEKPERAVEIFEEFSTGPRLEMFARRPRDGWTTWGNDPSLSDVDVDPVVAEFPWLGAAA